MGSRLLIVDRKINVQTCLNLCVIIQILVKKSVYHSLPPLLCLHTLTVAR